MVRALQPCDIFAAGGTPCVAAYSTVRALFADFVGALYEVERSDGYSYNVSAVGGYADGLSQVAFCGSSECTISRIFDQSPFGNDLSPAPGTDPTDPTDKRANASRDPLTFGGRLVYGTVIERGVGYRNDRATGTAVGDEAQTIYAVVSGTHYNDECCFDFGNAEVDDRDDGAGTMEALYFGNASGGLNHGGAGVGPWIMADMENALWGADVVESNETSIRHEYVTAFLKGDAGPTPGHWALKGGAAKHGSLHVFWDGPRAPGYSPMKKQGAIILGIGGDNSHNAVGTFYEGAMVRGYTSDATDDAVQASVVGAGYGT